MNNHLKNSFTLLLFFLVSIFFAISYLVYENEIKSIKEDTKNKTFIHSNEVKEHILIAKSLIFSLKNSLETSFELALHTPIYHPAYENIKFDEQFNKFHISNTY